MLNKIHELISQSSLTEVTPKSKEPISKELSNKLHELSLQLATAEVDLKDMKTHLEELRHRKESLIEEIATFISVLQVRENTNTEFVNKNLETLRLQLSEVLLSIKLLEIKYEWLEARRDALFAELWSYTDMDKLVEEEVPIFRDEN